MKLKQALSVLAAFGLSALCATAWAEGARQDDRAMEVLKSMSDYRMSLDRLEITGVTLTDARLDAGLMVTNTEEVRVLLDRPSSMVISNFDGVNKNELYFHDGRVTVYTSEKQYYAQAEIPADLDAALEFALEELDIEAPLMDMIYQDASAHLLTGEVEVRYLTDKARIAGVDCHHIALRGPDSDVQLWIQEGEQPLARKIMINSKWEGGSPRFIANMNWDTDPDVEAADFEFTPPDGAINIGFINRSNEEG